MSHHFRFFPIILVLLVLSAQTALADAMLTGTGDPARDVAAVQAAVRDGGTIRLKGTFDFGQEGRVSITRDVRLIGVRDSRGEPGAVIRGGFWSLYSPLPVKGAPPAKRGPLIAVHSIRFEHAKGTPLHFPNIGGLDLRDCIVRSIRPQTLKVTWKDGDSMLFQAGVVVGNRLDYRKDMLKRAASGTIRIEDNRFEMETPEPHMTAGRGVMIMWTWGADIAIRNNIINHASRNGVEVLDNTLDSKGRGSIEITGNRIMTEDDGFLHPNSFGSNGITAGWFTDTSGGADFSRNSRASVTGNRIEARGSNSTGILLYANDPVVVCNDIILGGGSASHGIIQTGSRGFFANNRVRGEGRYAFFCHPFESLRATANTFAWTDLNDFTPLQGQAYMNGAVNVLIGNVSLLTDKGKGNRVVDVPPCSLPEADPEGEAWAPLD
ncbi:right-handed parallel beta-helix repeat-containing protein [Pseudodesulfovibrio tunisiensis]|uniref:right-handed parallel beta-helix repeat-containing protein n=1 Tax=Pseudodesulfovibrio tunisiensis TaxID=463192 RepID=UPI001FB4779B|nr:right-handed parallel beta-helix repeat-containing protein [Pseudodesulfovibrio tunisiensis]